MTAVYQVSLMAVLILLGFVCVKVKIISGEGTKALSALVSFVANPATVFTAFQIEYSADKKNGLLLALALTLIAFAVSYAVVFLIIRGKDKDRVTIERIAAIYSNCGFMGIPLVRGVFGNEGVFYLAVYIAVFNLLIWTAGAMQVQGKADKRTVLNSFLNPSIIAVLLGVICFAGRIRLPRLISDSVGYLGDLTTPIAMLVAGALIAEADLAKLIKKHRAYFTSLIKLVVLPCAVYAVFLLIPADNLVKSIVLTAAACPTGAISVILAVRYNKESIYAAELFAMTTIISMFTLPFIVNLPF